MNTSLPRLLWVLIIAMLGGAAAAQAQPARPATAPRPVASAASQPDAVTKSPATRAAEAARTPGDLRPEHPVVPQVAVPLRRDAQPSKTAPGATGVGKVDDSAARCRAAETAADRKACEAKRKPANKAQ